MNSCSDFVLLSWSIIDKRCIDLGLLLCTGNSKHYVYSLSDWRNNHPCHITCDSFWPSIFWLSHPLPKSLVVSLSLSLSLLRSSLLKTLYWLTVHLQIQLLSLSLYSCLWPLPIIFHPVCHFPIPFSSLCLSSFQSHLFQWYLGHTLTKRNTCASTSSWHLSSSVPSSFPCIEIHIVRSSSRDYPYIVIL